MVDRIDVILDMQQKALDRIKRVDSPLINLLLYIGAEPKPHYCEQQHH